MQKIITSRNAQILSTEEQVTRTCNCRKSNPCPLEGNCLEKNIVYNATVTQENGTKDTYIGNTTDFKKRLAVHTQSFNSIQVSQTALSNHIHKLKSKNIKYSVTWKRIDRGFPFSPVTNECHLCTKEKFNILFQPELATINSRSEMYASCAHKKSVLLIPIPRGRKKGPGWSPKGLINFHHYLLNYLLWFSCYNSPEESISLLETLSSEI